MGVCNTCLGVGVANHVHVRSVLVDNAAFRQTLPCHVLVRWASDALHTGCLLGAAVYVHDWAHSEATLLVGAIPTVKDVCLWRIVVVRVSEGASTSPLVEVHVELTHEQAHVPLGALFWVSGTTTWHACTVQETHVYTKAIEVLLQARSLRRNSYLLATLATVVKHLFHDATHERREVPFIHEAWVAADSAHRKGRHEKSNDRLANRRHCNCKDSWQR
mmetsp:Transcript_35199/g.80585  ORF Transcript_35199/g.80585 Transcript_35199/m.80585 type:complete len:218 (+) Transcript_35199:337-990(+)